MSTYSVNDDVFKLSSIRADAREIILAGLGAIRTEDAVRNGIVLSDEAISIKGAEYSLEGIERIKLVAIGKCAIDATVALEDVLGDRLDEGFVLATEHEASRALKRSTLHQGTHPLPSDKNVAGSEKLLSFLEDTTERDLVMFVISGGGSTLLCLPEGSGTCVEEERIVDMLMQKGAVIEEINTVRKHISHMRGGHLAAHAHPARVISLIFSDVPGNDMTFVASGPTIKDGTSIEDAKAVLTKYGLEYTGIFIETPKNDSLFAHVENILFISNRDALDAMALTAEQQGYSTEVVTDSLRGEVTKVAKDIFDTLHSHTAPYTLLYGGETTVVVQEGGSGGRNDMLALVGLEYVDEGELLVSFASDGHDNSDHAGGLCDTLTRDHAREHKLDLRDYIERTDSYSFFSRTGDFISTGVTGTNVSDLIVALKNPQ